MKIWTTVVRTALLLIPLWGASYAIKQIGSHLTIDEVQARLIALVALGIALHSLRNDR